MLTWPYEWSVSMLADAGVLTLDLQLALVESGCALKDATAYNVQFDHGQPRFIDISSFERPRRRDIWFAMGQFQRMFVYPLLLCRYSGWDLRSYFLANLDGLDVRQVSRAFGWLEKLHPPLLFDVTLPDVLGRWADRRGTAKREILERPRDNPQAQILLLRSLRSKVRRLAAGYRPRGTWADYGQICNYEDQAKKAKKDLVRRFLESTRPGLVMDVGCNTGEFSRLAVECGAEVVAVDSDHDTVEVLYRDLRKNPAPITPMVIDLCNPSPGIGLMNRERPPFLGRFRPDCVLALALIHHLLVSGNLPLAAIRDMMHELTERDLILEFVPTDDSMFRRLMKFRADLFAGLTLDACRDVFLQRFELLREEPIAGSKRTLLFLRKK